MAFKALGTGTNGDLYNDPLYDYGAFDDTVLVLANSGSHRILTGEGNDTVYAQRVAFSITAAIQTAYLGFGDDRYFGSAMTDVVYDGNGNDTVDLGAGNDIAFANEGNDVFIGGAGNDTINFETLETDGSGSFASSSNSVTFDLSITAAQNLGVWGMDRFSGFENVTGTAGNDRISGDNGDNILRGTDVGSINTGPDRDVLDGRGGNDTLFGSGGADFYIGGLGQDTIDALDPNSGFGSTTARDTIRFLSIAESGATTASADIILNFDKGGLATDDKIDLSAIDSNSATAANETFAFRGTATAFSSAGGEVRIVVYGANSFVYIDNDADTAVEMIIKVTGVTGLTSADFIL